MCVGSRNTVHHFHVSADELIRIPKAASPALLELKLQLKSDCMCTFAIPCFGLLLLKKKKKRIIFFLLLNNPAASLLKVSRFEVFSKLFGDSFFKNSVTVLCKHVDSLK